MDSAFETRTLALTFDLLTDQLPNSIGKATGILWKDVLTSPKFHNAVTLKVRDAFIKEYGRSILVSKDFYNDNIEDIRGFISKSTSEHGKNFADSYMENSPGGKKLENLSSDLEKSLKEIEDHFNHSKAGIWINEATKSVTVIVSIILVGSYGVYSFRNTKLIQNIVNTASFFGLTTKSIHVGGIKITGEISDYSIRKSTVELKASASKRWKSIQVEAKSNGVINFNTGQIMDSSTNVTMIYSINEKLKVSGGLTSSIKEKSNDKFKQSAYIKMHLSSGTNNFSLGCSITDKPNSPINKECTASASVNF